MAEAVDRAVRLGRPVSSNDVRFAVRLTPRGVADRVDGVVDGVLHARVSAPPVESAANHALIKLIAGELGVPRGAVHLIAGASGRTKLLAVEGVSAEAVEERWPGIRL
jgi:uncharacterized protein